MNSPVVPRVASLGHPLAQDLAYSGGKGASLARAAAHGLPVPPAVVVLSSAYREFVRPLESRVQALLADPACDDAQRSAGLRALLLSQPLPEDLLRELACALREAGLDDRPVAVRSSGTMEDLPGVSFAGQHDTLLGVRGLDDVAQAVRQCFASLWNAHVLPYRERMGLAHGDAAMAVVVQELVQVGPHDAAGVAFSVDPVRGSLDEVLINAAFGLGETVVAGDSPVDEYRVRRSPDGGETEARIVDKPQALVPDASVGGTRRVALSSAQSGQPALQPSQREAVAQLALSAEAHFGFPQDIEWGYQGERLLLLQSRPVTRIPARWTRDESAERFPNALTPLSWDLCEEGFHASLTHSLRLMGLPPFGGKWFGMHGYCIYGNQNAVRLYGACMPAARSPDLDSLLATVGKCAWVSELPVRWMRDLDAYLIALGGLMGESVADRPLPVLWEHLLRIKALGTTYFLPNIAISLTQRMLYGVLERLLAMTRPAEEVKPVFDRLLAVTDTKTGQVNAELWALARELRADAPLHAALAAGAAEAVLAQLPDHPRFASRFKAFLDRHGHRELDFDAYHPTWVEAPASVLDALRMLADQPDPDPAAEHDAKRRQFEAEQAVLGALPERLRRGVSEVIRLARTYTALDDLEHYQTTRLTLPLRRVLRAIGQRLVERGALAEPMDVFFVPFRELGEAILTDRLDDLAATVSKHKAGHAAARLRSPDWVLGEREEADTANAPGDGAAALQGLGGSAGVVEGVVARVRGPEDFACFPEGAILVARTTHPAWTPLFYRARGVVTESGGPLSHGAVVARELGLPAVMGVRHALQRLRDGQRVRVDGRAGTVACLD